MMKWEYTTYEILGRNGATPDDANSEKIDLFRLQQLGEQGWEMVAVNAGIAYFKRPIVSN